MNILPFLLIIPLKWKQDCCSFAKLCPTLCDPMNYNTPDSWLPWPSLSPGVCSNSSPLSQWCYLTISSSGAPFFSCPQSFPASGSFPVSQLFTSGGQSIGASALVLPMNSQGWFPLGLTGRISLQSKGPSRVFSSTTVFSTQKVLFCLAALAGGPSNTFLI